MHPQNAKKDPVWKVAIYVMFPWLNITNVKTHHYKKQLNTLKLDTNMPAQIKLAYWIFPPIFGRAKLVGGWTNPSEKYDRQIGSFPQFSGWKYIKIFELPPPRQPTTYHPKADLSGWPSFSTAWGGLKRFNCLIMASQPTPRGPRRTLPRNTDLIRP